MPINTTLNSKTRLLRKKKAHKISQTYYGALFFQVHASRNCLFLGTFIDTRFSDVYRSLDERYSTHINP